MGYQYSPKNGPSRTKTQFPERIDQSQLLLKIEIQFSLKQNLNVKLINLHPFQWVSQDTK